MNGGSGAGPDLQRRPATDRSGVTPAAVSTAAPAPSAAAAATAAAAPGGGGPAARLEQQLQSRRIHVDRIAAVVAFIQIATGTADAMARDGCRPLLVGSLALHAAHAWLLFGPAAGWYASNRTAVAAALLVALRLLTALQIPGCSNPGPGNLVTLSFRLLYKTGFVPLLWYFAAIPLPFPLAATLHVLAAVLYNRTLIHHACRHVFVLPGDDTLLRGSWQTATELVAAASPLVGGLLTPAGPVASAPSTPGTCTAEGGDSGQHTCLAGGDPANVCAALMTFGQATLGVWAPLVVAYVLHLRARRQLCSSDGGSGGDENGRGGAALQQGSAAAAAAPEGEAAVWCTAFSGPWDGTEAAAGRCVAPLAVLFATAAVSNIAYFAVARAWSV